MLNDDWFLSLPPRVNQVKRLLTVLLADAVLLYALYYFFTDLQWRTTYAGTLHGHTTGYVASFTYSFFTRVFTMSGNGVTLTSPPTLDWVQVIGLLLAIANGWYLYSRFSHWKRPYRATPALQPQ